MLSGASYLDPHMIYGVGISDAYTLFNTAIKWINETLKMSVVTALMNEDQVFFQCLSNKFSVDSDEKNSRMYWSDRWIGCKNKMPLSEQ